MVQVISKKYMLCAVCLAIFNLMDKRIEQKTYMSGGVRSEFSIWDVRDILLHVDIVQINARQAIRLYGGQSVSRGITPCDAAHHSNFSTNFLFQILSIYWWHFSYQRTLYPSDLTLEMTIISRLPHGPNNSICHHLLQMYQMSSSHPDFITIILISNIYQQLICLSFVSGGCYSICEHGLKLYGSLLDLTPVDLNFRGSLLGFPALLTLCWCFDSGSVWKDHGRGEPAYLIYSRSCMQFSRPVFVCTNQ